MSRLSKTPTLDGSLGNLKSLESSCNFKDGHNTQGLSFRHETCFTLEVPANSVENRPTTLMVLVKIWDDRFSVPIQVKIMWKCRGVLILNFGKPKKRRLSMNLEGDPYQLFP